MADGPLPSTPNIQPTKKTKKTKKKDAEAGGSSASYNSNVVLTDCVDMVGGQLKSKDGDEVGFL